jgi:hypothetical protein
MAVTMIYRLLGSTSARYWRANMAANVLWIAPESTAWNASHVEIFAPSTNAFRTSVVHNGVMPSKEKTVRQSVTLPAKVATQVRSMAKRRRLSANRMLIELVEEGLEAKQQKEKAFFELAERFRAAADPKEVERLGEELGQMVFGR